MEESLDKAVARLKVYKYRMSQAYNTKVISISFQVEDVVKKKR